ncbi:CPBP family intramembrane glutamic endopeptidase [Streptomyces sp. NPDC008001]|uniref:CPBP family intramembrane glutamic endopeptidase n=1 Tax=Streptomyces sp. NPDC008001 TaxID=3364804 RepID=UPI0036E1F5D2
MHPTPTPELAAAAEARTYLWAALALCGASCLTLAAHLRTRWLARLGVRFMPVHVCVMTVLAAAGIAALGPRGIATGPLWPGAAGPVAGAACGLLVIRSDAALTRWSAARARARPGTAARGSARRPQETRVRAVRPVRAPGASPGDGPRRRVMGIAKGRGGYVPTADDYRVGLGWLLAVAVLEELVFRGVLLRMALRPGNEGLRVAGIVGVVAMFALSHIFFGWAQVLAKLPLSVLATAATLVTGSVWAAAVTHMVFNAYVWRCQTALRIGYRRKAAGP